MTDQLKKACVILGAGASMDIDGVAGPPVNKGWRPPLANELFDITARRDFESHLMQYPGAQSLAQDIAEVVSVGKISLEARMRELAFHDDDDIREAFKEIPPYIRDVIKDCSRLFVNYPSGYSRLAQYLVSEVPHETLFIVLNYDNMLEKVLRNLYRIPFQKMTDYMENRRNIRILKFHGSIDWLIPIGEAAEWHEALKSFSLADVASNNIVITDTTADLVNFRGGGSFYFPALTAPIAGKDEDSIMAPPAQVEASREFLRDCKKVLIVGCSGVDEDLIHFLNEGFNEDAYVQIVGKDGGAQSSASKFKGVASFNISLYDNEESTVFRQGFKAYLRSDWFQRFLLR